MRKIFVLFLFSLLFFIGCNINNELDDQTALFLTSDNVLLFGNNNININNHMNYDFDLLFDQNEHKLWLHSIENKKSIFELFDKNGTIVEKTIINYENETPTLGGKPYITNNIALISTAENNEYICVNLIDKTYFIICLNQKEYLYKEKMGFSGKYIFWKDGYYNIEKQKMEYYPVNIQYPSYMAEIDKVVGIDNIGNTVLIDCDSKNYEILPIKKRQIFPTKFYYPSGSLYYVNYEYIYYSVFSKWYPEEFYFTFFMTGYEPVCWYRYDRITGENVLIKSPTVHSKILGIIK